MLTAGAKTGSAQVLVNNSFDTAPDWQSAESYSPANYATWPATWVNNPGGPTQPPPQGFSSYRSAIPARAGDPHTFVLSAEGARNSGGKGITYNIESSSYGTWSGGGLDMYLGNTGYKEIFLRLYLKYDPNTFHWGTIVPNFGMQKVGRISRLKCVPDTGATCNPMVFYSGSSQQAPTFYPDFMNNPAYNTPPSINAIHAEPSVVYDPGAGSANPDDQWQIPWPSDGQWHSYEYRLKMNSAPGVADGEWELWIDGSSDTAHHALKSGIAWVGSTGSVNPGWNWVTVLDNNTIQPDAAYTNTVLKLFMDDLVVATNYSGPPPAPTNVAVKATSGTSAHLSWSAGSSTAQYQLDGYRVYYGTDPANLSNIYAAGTATAADITNLQSGQTYYFAVTAYNRGATDTTDNESLDSTKVSVPLAAGTTPTDTTAPTATLSAPLAGATVSGTTTIAATAADNVGVSKVEFYVNGALYGVAGAAPYSVSWNTTAYADGSYTVMAKAYDAAGNVGQSGSATVQVKNQVLTQTSDATAPVVGSFSMPATASSLTVPVSALSATDNVGVTGYLVTEGATPPAATATGWSASAPTSFTFAAAGSRTAYAWGKDAAGNVSASRSAAVSITLPTGPSVTLTPTDGSSVSNIVNITTSATSPVGVTQLRIYVDSVLKTYVNGSSLSYAWDTTTSTAGSHAIMVYAFDKNNNLTIVNEKVNVTAATPADTTAPSATVSSPAPSATVSGTSTVSIAASDNVAVSKVEFYVNGALQGTDTASPYTFSWNTTALANGSYTLSAKAYDAAGNVGQAANVQVTVFNDTTAPTATVSSPAASSTVSGSSTVSIAASDNVGVTKVEFYVNGVLQGTDTASPYTFSWNTAALANGSYTLSAKAYDAAGNVGQAPSVQVSVLNDATAPTVTAFTMPATSTTVTVPVSTFSATDNVAVTGYLITESATAPAASATGWSATAPTSFTFAGTGARTAYAWTRDAAGNVSAARTAAVTITAPDTTPPAVNIATPYNGATVTKTRISASATDQGGIIQMRIYVDKVLMAVTSASSISYNWDASKAAKGAHTIEVWAFDSAKNIGISSVTVYR